MYVLPYTPTELIILSFASQYINDSNPHGAVQDIEETYLRIAIATVSSICLLFAE